MPGSNFATRRRSRSRHILAGSATWHGVGSLGPIDTSYDEYEVVDDVVGNRYGNNPFYHYRSTGVNWYGNGVSGPLPDFRWSYFEFASVGTPADRPPTTPIPSDSDALQMAFTRQNPNTPVTDVPVFLIELRDLPRMLESAGDFLRFSQSLSKLEKDALWDIPYQAADKFLGYEFGIKPLVRDLRNMVNFVNLVQKKYDELNLLYSKAGVGQSKSSTVYTDTASGSPGDYYLTGLYQETNYFRFIVETRRKKWVSMKWFPLDPPPENDAGKLALALTLVYGLNISFSTLWEATPWSWLVDWFTNFGNFLNSRRNVIPVSAEGSCLMQQTSTGWTSAQRLDGSGGYPTFPKGGSVLEQIRTPGAGPVGASVTRDLAFLSAEQLSILVSLVATRIGQPVR